MKYEYTNEHPYVTKLIARHGAGKASEMLGLSSGYLGRAVTDQKVRVSYELAAETLWRRDNPQGKTTMLVLVMDRGSEAETTVKTMVSALGVKSMEFVHGEN